MIKADIAMCYTVLALQPSLEFIESKVLEATSKGHSAAVFDFDIATMPGGFGSYISLMNHLQYTLGYSVKATRKVKGSSIRELGLFWGNKI